MNILLSVFMLYFLTGLMVVQEAIVAMMQGACWSTRQTISMAAHLTGRILGGLHHTGRVLEFPRSHTGTGMSPPSISAVPGNRVTTTASTFTSQGE